MTVRSMPAVQVRPPHADGVSYFARDEFPASGLSGSLDRSKAEWFARRWPTGEALLVHATFPKMAVLAYFEDLGEAELIVNWRRACAPEILGIGSLALV
jgi:hypothetical protein